MTAFSDLAVPWALLSPLNSFKKIQIILSKNFFVWVLSLAKGVRSGFSSWQILPNISNSLRQSSVSRFVGALGLTTFYQLYCHFFVTFGDFDSLLPGAL